MSALVNLPPDVPQDMEQEDVVELLNLSPDVPQDMEQEDVVELLIPGNNMKSSVIIQCEYCGGGSPTWGKSLGMYHRL